jgi:two-component system, OmpR family, alkaline phosphatase synthesis response regulator PhoP
VSGPLLLLADDEPNIRDTLAFLLEMEGYRVELAGDGEEALAKARALRPAVLLLDAMMPRLDGFSVCRTIRREPGLEGVRIVVITALGQRADRERALAAGADHYFVKPFVDEELLAVLRRLAPGA